MTKNDFIKNLKSHKASTNAFAKKSGIFGALFIIISLLLLWLNLKIIASVILLVFLISYILLSARQERITDKENSMFCINCDQRFNQNTFSIAILENKCQDCGAKIYDTQQ